MNDLVEQYFTILQEARNAAGGRGREISGVIDDLEDIEAAARARRSKIGEHLAGLCRDSASLLRMIESEEN